MYICIYIYLAKSYSVAAIGNFNAKFPFICNSKIDYFKGYKGGLC